MKIGIDIRTLMDKKYSGVSNYTFNLVNELLKIDRNNQYKLYYNSWQDLQGRLPVFSYDNVEIIGTKYPNKIFNYGMQKIFSRPLVDKLLGVDVFFMPHINFVSLSGKCRKIICIHDLSFLRYPEYFSLRKNIWHKLIGIKNLLYKFDFIIAISENTKRDLIELLNIPEEKVKVIYTGIKDVEEILLNEKMAEIAKKYKLPEKYFLFLGNIEPRKNIEAIVQAFDEINYKDFHLVLAGEAGWKNKSTFGLINRIKSGKRIHVIGYVDEDDKKYIYRKASAFIYPSFYEGFGLPILEAMSFGVPVITSANSSLPEVARNAVVLINPYNINDLKRALSFVISDAGLKDRMSAQFLTFKSQFSWVKAAEKYLELFQG